MVKLGGRRGDRQGHCFLCERNSQFGSKFKIAKYIGIRELNLSRVGQVFHNILVLSLSSIIYWLCLECIISPWPADGNITCPDSPVNRGKFFVNSGHRCQLGKGGNQLKTYSSMAIYTLFILSHTTNVYYTCI